MKAALQTAALCLAAACWTGCGEGTERVDAGESAASEQLFEKGRGVRLPPQMHQQLRVETVEVTERPVPWRAQKSAQVYRAADASTSAAAVSWLDPDEAGYLRVGQSIPLLSLSAQTPELSGVLRRLETDGSRPAGLVEGVIEFDDREGRFPVGSFLNATFAAPRTNAVLAVPASAVVDGVAGAFVYAANGGHFTRTPVKTGATADGWVEIRDGLYAGDVIVSRAAGELWMIELCALKGGSPCCPAPLAAGGKK